jgi:benzoyl-CoA reductase/2-hydroxyglutaryl-CoA dehydratase subunit BcrC/BadD/HgdB
MNSTQRDFADSIARLRLDPHAVARAAAQAGERVVGYVGEDVPIALILAADALPVRLHGAPDSATPRIDALVESSFAPLLRAVAEQWLEGRLDHLDAVVFTRADDSSQRLYYYMCELQRRGLCAGPRPLLFDLASLARRSSFEHTLESVRLLATALGATENRLEAALRRIARRAQLLQAVRARRALPAPLRGSAAWAAEYAAGCDWREDFDERAHRWLEEAALLFTPRRVVLAGDPLPDDGMHLAVEICGASIVLELNESSVTGVANRRDALGAVAEEYRRRESPAVSMRHNPRWLAEAALAQRADAVVLWASEQNEALPWEIPRQMKSLRDAGIPALLLARQPRQLSALTLEQVMHFVRNPKE